MVLLVKTWRTRGPGLRSTTVSRSQQSDPRSRDLTDKRGKRSAYPSTTSKSSKRLTESTFTLETAPRTTRESVTPCALLSALSDGPILVTSALSKDSSSSSHSSGNQVIQRSSQRLSKQLTTGYD